MRDVRFIKPTILPISEFIDQISREPMTEGLLNAIRARITHLEQDREAKAQPDLWRDEIAELKDNEARFMRFDYYHK